MCRTPDQLQLHRTESGHWDGLDSHHIKTCEAGMRMAMLRLFHLGQQDWTRMVCGDSFPSSIILAFIMSLSSSFIFRLHLPSLLFSIFSPRPHETALHHGTSHPSSADRRRQSRGIVGHDGELSAKVCGTICPEVVRRVALHVHSHNSPIMEERKCIYAHKTERFLVKYRETVRRKGIVCSFTFTYFYPG